MENNPHEYKYTLIDDNGDVIMELGIVLDLRGIDINLFIRPIAQHTQVSNDIIILFNEDHSSLRLIRQYLIENGSGVVPELGPIDEREEFEVVYNNEFMIMINMNGEDNVYNLEDLIGIVLDNLADVIENIMGQAPPYNMPNEEIVERIIISQNGPRGATQVSLEYYVNEGIITMEDSYNVYLELYEYFYDNSPSNLIKPVSTKLTNEEFESIFVIRPMSKKIKETVKIETINCTVCLDEVKSRQHCAITPCIHIFHKNCAKEWFCKMCIHPKCPNCRSNVRDAYKDGLRVLRSDLKKSKCV